MRRPAFKEVERLERPVDLNEPTELEAPVTVSETADGSAAARGLSLAVIVSAAIWLLIVGVIALALA